MAGVNSRAKGKRGELDAAKAWQAIGVAARRGRQYAGHPEAPDLVLPELRGVHVEVARKERLNLHAKLLQAAKDAAPGEVPLVQHRRSREPWFVTVALVDLPRLARALLEATDPMVLVPKAPPPRGATSGGSTAPGREAAEKGP